MSKFVKTGIIMCYAAAMAILFTAASEAQTPLKIGYIRPQYIFSKYEPYKQAEKELKDYEKEEVDKLKKLGEEFQKEVESAEKQALLMSEEMIDKKRQELATRRENLDQLYDQLYKTPGGKLIKKQEELLQPIISLINEVITRVGKEDGYDYILDAEGPVLFADEKYDISDYLLEELEKDISSQ
ncbi:OmpH family outer membrane protein [Candidatus Latescibacterota bacterium]